MNIVKLRTQLTSAFGTVLFISTLMACGNPQGGSPPSDLPAARVTGADWVSASDAADRILRNEEDITFSRGPALEMAKNLALTILSDAAAATEPAQRTIFKTLMVALESAKLDVPEPGKDLKQCQREQNVLAFVMTSEPHTIHLCQRALAKGQKKSLAQILIHETSHVAGVYDECQATRIEVAAMRDSRVGLAFHNGYMGRCGIH